jgi:acetyl esterase/lipase
MLPIWRLFFDGRALDSAPGVEIGEHDARGARVRTYRPTHGMSGAALVWMHGGGFIVGSARGDDLRCSTLARELGVFVASVDYRLAPENPFPAAIDDCHAAWQWLQDSAVSLGIEPDRVAVGGVSAGGGLAACLAQRALDAGGVQPRAQVLVYPMLDDRTAARLEHDATRHGVWSNRSNRAGWASYLGRDPGPPELPPYAAAARRGDLSGLPPAWIGVGDLDLFLEEDRAYARRLSQAGVPTELYEVPGAPHGFLSLAPDAPVAHDFESSQAGFLDAQLGE